MNPAVALAITAAVVGALVTLLGLRFGSAPGWAPYRHLALVAATASLYCAIDVTSTLHLDDDTTVFLMKVQNLVAALHVAAWQVYVQRRLGTPRGPRYRIVLGILFFLGALWMVPGLNVSREMLTYSVPWLGVQYRQAAATTFGSLSLAAELAFLALPMMHYVRATRAGARDAPVHVFALAAILVTAINDALVATDLVHGPLLISLGFMASVGGLGLVLTREFVESARELDRLSRHLEQVVEQRTRELVDIEAALLRAEKMAALGRISAGVAHEINNPASAVSSNVAYLRDSVILGKLPADAIDCLDDSLEAVARITKIVSQLIDSGGAAPILVHDGSSASVMHCVQSALDTARPRIGDNVTTSVDVPSGLFVRADESSLVQVLVNLVVNAAQAIPVERRAGRIAVRSFKDGQTIRIAVDDDGTGMAEETKRRLFEPFFTTKPHGQGTGLGLSVSRGIVRSMGGDLEVSSSPAGTSMTLVLVTGQ